MKLVEYPDPRLFEICHPVRQFDSRLHTELDLMAELMKSENGVGIAANQCGLQKRMFVFKTEYGTVLDIINPVLVEFGDIGHVFKEGCLSSKGVYEFVDRFNTVVINYNDRDGNDRTFYAAEPRDSVCIQHEMDHLNGVFFFDRLSRNLRLECIKKWEKVQKLNEVK